MNQMGFAIVANFNLETNIKKGGVGEIQPVI
jgi:hypothetical protein